jgi:predicted secreted Zn-dependent protease
MADPRIDVHYKFYWIYPKSKQDLGRELDRRSPIIFKGKKYRGYTQWQVTWNYRWWETTNSCKVTTAQTQLKVTFTLPKIPNNHPVDAQTRQGFNRYFQALFKHEQNHQQSGVLAAKAIESMLLGLPSFSTCAQLENVANQLGYKIIKKYRQRDLDYDRRTDHGRTEGVMLER